MKRSLAIILAATLLAAALASCALPSSTGAAIGANVRLTSSDGEDAALISIVFRPKDEVIE